MDENEFRKASHAVVEDIIKYNASLADRPVLPNVQPGYLRSLIPAQAPQQAETWSSVQEDVQTKIVPGLTHWQSPKFMAFFPALVTYPSVLGEIYSAAFTAPAFNWLCSPACTELETIVMDWVAKALALPEDFLSTSSGGGGGVIHGSASEAVITAMVAARERYLREKVDTEGLEEGSHERDDRIAFLRGRLVALSSDQAHSSTPKGAKIAGTRHHCISTSLASGLALTAPRLKKALEECYDQGLEPYYVTLSLGTTNTCAVDDFASIAALRSEYPNLWIHIDAAYAGAAMVLPQYQTQYSTDIGKVSDSFNVNMHKWLLVNFDASCFFVKNRNHLTRALAITPAYLQNSFTDSGLVTDYRDWQIPLGRRFRALKIWFVMRTYGVEGLRKHIANSISIGEKFADMVRGRNDLFEIVAEPKFALTCLRVKPEAAFAASQNRIREEGGHESSGISSDLNRIHPPQAHSLDEPTRQASNFTKRAADLINSRGQIFITASTLADVTFIRVISGHPAASVEYLGYAWRVIVETVEEILSAP